jgi:hypothetical protein
VEPADGPEHTPFVEGRMSGVHSTLNSYTVYFLQGIDGGPIKIGHTVGDVRERIGQIQYCSPVKLRVIGVISGVGPRYEQDLHFKFKGLRLHGEWFEPSVELLNFVTDHAVLWDGSDSAPLSRENGEPRTPPVIGNSEPESAELIQTRAILILREAAWSLPDILQALRISRMTYFRRMRLVRQVEKGKAG